jgi:hypothetical protein
LKDRWGEEAQAGLDAATRAAQAFGLDDDDLEDLLECGNPQQIIPALARVGQALAMLDKLDQAEKEFQRKRLVALASSRLPEARSTDPTRLSIATRILQTPRYQFGEFGTIVLTTDRIIEREKKSSEIDIDKLELSLSGDLKASGTETGWTYRWQEFKFAVPLKETDGSWAIWWITAKNYSSGAANTPIGSWVSGRAEKGNPIPRENF